MGKSLQLISNGNSYADFVWSLEDTTLAALNIDQSFLNEATIPVVEVSEPNLRIVFLLFAVILFLIKNNGSYGIFKSIFKLFSENAN